jgi:FAD:protein FMN transferase
VARVRTALVREVRAMASTVTCTVVEPGPGAHAALTRAELVVRQVERTCSRFDPSSALSRANAAPDVWHEVPATLGLAISEAARAHEETAGVFDPRVLDALLTWGYDAGLTFGEDGPVTGEGRGRPGGVQPRRVPWRPHVELGADTARLHLGGSAVDLGGIGKGLAVRWAGASLVHAGAGAMVDAGGDLVVRGASPDGERWLVGVEDPAGADEPLVVLGLRDTACATSSIRRRRWRAGGGEVVHHLVDPRTGRPGGAGLLGVTVAAEDPAWAEVWAKALFLEGAAGVRRRAEQHDLAALWVRADGTVGSTAPMGALVVWSGVALA